MNYPITEYDIDDGILSPQLMVESDSIPKECILCFFPTVFQTLTKEFNVVKIVYLYSPLGDHPIYVVSYKDVTFSIFNPGLGGPMTGGFLEELIALGASRFILCGSAGGLTNIDVGALIVPEFAIRDEGTSYHYLPASDSVFINSTLRSKVIGFLNKYSISYNEGGTWTTDAIYRETPERKKRRLSQGCVCVDMEVASLAAISIYRNVQFTPLLYSGDILDEVWDSRSWKEGISSQLNLFYLCCELIEELCCELE